VGQFKLKKKKCCTILRCGIEIQVTAIAADLHFSNIPVDRWPFGKAAANVKYIVARDWIPIEVTSVS
jgi:hypothetical protein